MTGSQWDVERIVSITDGDTLRLVRRRVTHLDNLELTVRDGGPNGVAARLVWVDTPEKGTHPGWENARADLGSWVSAAPLPLTAYVYDGGAGWDRLLVDLIDAEGNSASQWLMVEKGWPPYIGAKA